MFGTSRSQKEAASRLPGSGVGVCAAVRGRRGNECGEPCRMALSRRCAALLLAVVSCSSLLVAPARADHGDGVFELESHANWDHGDLSVLVVPPTHGQIFNFDTGALNGADPAEATPFNSYLAAIEAAIQAWEDAIDLLGAQWLKEYYDPTVYVLGRDQVPQEVLTAPDVLVVTDEDEGPSLGTAIWAKTGYVRTPCVVRMSKSSLLSFTYADMFNVTAQEYGHCLGLGHVGSQAGVDPTSEQKHPEHDVMNGFYPHWIGDAGTHLHCVSNLDVMALEHVFDYKLDYSGVLNLGVPGLTFMPTEAYGDACELPPSSWRSSTPPTALPGAADMNSAIRSPRDGKVLRASAFKKVKGVVWVDQSLEEVPYTLDVALSRVSGDGSCLWWKQEANAFTPRDCYSPVWHPASLDEADRWSWRPPSGLPPGDYRLISRVLTEYGNEPIEEDNEVLLRIAPGRTGGARA